MAHPNEEVEENGIMACWISPARRDLARPSPKSMLNFQQTLKLRHNCEG